MDYIEDPPEGTSTLFGIFRKHFPSDKQSKIITSDFLDASKGVIVLIDKLGKIFAPVKHDMNGNVVKITKKFQENPEEYLYLEDMILAEKAEGQTNKTIDALQWLRRGLHFIQRYLELILSANGSNIQSPRSPSRRHSTLVSLASVNAPSNDHSALLRRAYEETLEPHHGWLGAQLFGILSRFAPSRADLFFILAYDTKGAEAEIAVEQEMTIFIKHLKACVEKLTHFYKFVVQLREHTDPISGSAAQTTGAASGA